MRRLEQPQYHAALVAGLTYLVKVSDVDEPEIFKICLDYWHHLSHDLYVTECQRAPSKDPTSVSVPTRWRVLRRRRDLIARGWRHRCCQVSVGATPRELACASTRRC